MSESGQPCELCEKTGGTKLWESPACRIVRVDDPDYPGFCRVIWNAHAREMSDLDPRQRQYLMSIVFAVESAVRLCFQPDKINLASFGNMVPHVHWHIIPRWRNDRHFPEPIWGAVHRTAVTPRKVVSDAELIAALAQSLGSSETQSLE